MTVTVPPQSEADKNRDRDGYSASDQRFNRPDALCEFTRKTSAGESTLLIDVKTMNDPAKEFGSFLTPCAGTTALRGIGNEAVQCAGKADSDVGRERVIARVRERIFTLTVQRPPAPPAASGKELRDDTRNIAEQVAGSIF